MTRTAAAAAYRKYRSEVVAHGDMTARQFDAAVIAEMLNHHPQDWVMWDAVAFTIWDGCNAQFE